MTTRLHITRNQDVIDAAARALLEARKLADPFVADMLLDIYGMLFVEVDER